MLNIVSLGKFMIKTMIFIQLINFILSECDINKPIKVNGECLLKYCTKEEFLLKNCTIDNTIIKTQWLTNIIQIGHNSSRYINFVTTKNGDMIVETTACPGDYKRIFYGLKSNGKGLFLDKLTNKETPFYIFNSATNFRYESAVSIIQISNNNNNNDKLYILNIAKSKYNTELYDFEENFIYENTTSNFTGNRSEAIVSDLIELNYKENGENNFYYLYPALINKDNRFHMSFQKYIFYNKDITKSSNYLKVNEKTYITTNRKIVSCFETKLYRIVCFFQTLQSDLLKYSIVILNQNLEEINLNIIDEEDKVNDETNIFYKTIHLKEEAGVFIYYKSLLIYNPIIVFKYYNERSNNLEDYFSSISTIVIDKYPLSNNLTLNDIIKMSDNKTCFTALSKEKEVLYIIILNIYKSTEYKINIRYYSIEIYNLYRYKVLNDLRIHIYNEKYLALGTSYCRVKKCDNDKVDIHSSSLIIFSYPNITDINLNLVDYLFNNNSIQINNLEFDLNENAIIENNIFGYEKVGIKILKIIKNGEFNIISTKTGNNIAEDTFLEGNIHIKFSSNENYYKMNFTIEYMYYVQKPNYNNYNKYAVYFDYNKIDINEENEYLREQEIKIGGRIGEFFFYLDTDLTIDCNDQLCNLCLMENKTQCIKCNNDNYILDEHNLNKICIKETDLTDSDSNLLIENTLEIKYSDFVSTSTNYSTLNSLSDIIKISSTENELSDIINNTYIYLNDNLCSGNDIINYEYIGELSNEELNNIYNSLKNKLNNKECNKTLIKTKNIIFQISEITQQLNPLYQNISFINLEECENRIKEKYNIPSNKSLIIFKIDIKDNNLLSTNVQYEVFNPINYQKIDLSICSDISISIEIPLELDDNILSLYKNLDELGYNLFNPNDKFYNDICTPYTTENGTDIILSDRKNDIYKPNSNISLCQFGCEFDSYNTENKKVKCQCSVQTNETNFVSSKNENILNKVKESFYNTFKFSNFFVVKCYKLLLNFKDYKTNIGSIILLILLILFLILMMIYIIKDNKKINKLIQLILNDYLYNKNNNKNDNKYIKKKVKKDNKIINNHNGSNKTSKKNSKINVNVNVVNKNNIYVQKNDINNNPKDIETKIIKKKKPKNFKIRHSANIRSDILNLNVSFPPKKNTRNKDIKMNNLRFQNNSLSSVNESLSIFNKKNKKKSLKNLGFLEKEQKIKTKKSKEKNKKFSEEKIKYNDYELNNLTYEEAIKNDKRTYFQYYISLLKTKHLILFTFLPINDYNLVTLKISLFILSISLYFLINSFFFNDDTMHKLYIDNGAFDFIFQIPQILYSSIISFLINKLLKFLSLSEKNLLDIKNEDNYQEKLKISKDIKKNLIIKFMIFFIIGILLMVFFWYFISCFCFVYRNAQIPLIKDTIFSFCLSMIYPFGLNLLPGILRIPSLRAIKKDKQLLYKISLLVSLI